MENKRFNSESHLFRKKILNIDGTIEHLLPKFLLSDLIEKSDKVERPITDSTRDENIEGNFTNLDIYDPYEDNDPIMQDYKLDEVN